MSSKFFMSVFIILVSGLITFLIGVLLAIPIFNVNLFTNPDILTSSNIDYITISKYYQIVISIGAFVFPPFIISYVLSDEKLGYIGIGKTSNLISIVLVILSALVVIPLINYFGLLNSGMSLPESLSGIENWMREMEDQAAELTLMYIEMNSISDLMINLLMLAIIPALGEELLFRGVFQRIFTDWSRNIHLGVFISAVLFSAFHFQFFGFLPRLILGVFFGYLFVWSKNIWLPVVGHFVNNSFIVLFYYFSNVETREEIMSNDNIDISFPTVFASGTIFLFLVYLIYRKERNLLKV